MQAYIIGDFDTRPWGSYVVTNVGETPLHEEFCEKEITVLPGKILSLQSHEHRRETWRVISGTLTVVLDDRKVVLNAGESLFIPLHAIHAMANTSTEPCVVFERQEGLCREEDIIRYSDAYGRADEAIAHDDRIQSSLAVYKLIADQLS